jgi:hypothetical protein
MGETAQLFDELRHAECVVAVCAFPAEAGTQLPPPFAGSRKSTVTPANDVEDDGREETCRAGRCQGIFIGENRGPTVELNNVGPGEQIGVQHRASAAREVVGTIGGVPPVNFRETGAPLGGRHNVLSKKPHASGMPSPTPDRKLPIIESNDSRNNSPAVLHPSEHSAPGATGPLPQGFDVHPQRSVGHIIDPEDDHLGQAH